MFKKNKAAQYINYWKYNNLSYNVWILHNLMKSN